MKSPNAATPSGTSNYRKRMTQLSPDHFRQQQRLWLSSLGLGSYLGNTDDVTDANYHNAIIRALELGCNVFDAAINYRCQRSERVIGRTLNELFKEGKYKRDEVVVATKGGFIPFDGSVPADPREYFEETFVIPGILTPKDLVAGCHCLTIPYLEHQLQQSLNNLGLDTIDIYYLHNPEIQLQEISRAEFHQRIRQAFELLERKVTEGKISFYGTATWTGYRQPDDAGDYLDLAALVKIAQEVGGHKHHFRFIQLPYNLAMPEALNRENQLVGKQPHSVLEAAEEYDITIITSASLLQSRLAQSMAEELREGIAGLRTDAQRALQFVRSTQGVTTALIGMSRVQHVEENMELATHPTMSREDFLDLFEKE